MTAAWGMLGVAWEAIAFGICALLALYVIGGLCLGLFCLWCWGYDLLRGE